MKHALFARTISYIEKYITSLTRMRSNCSLKCLELHKTCLKFLAKELSQL